MVNKNEMFCFQCEQAAKGIACTKVGVCGKSADTSVLQDNLTGLLSGLSKAVIKNVRKKEADEVMLRGLFVTITNVNFDNEAINKIIDEVKNITRSIEPDNPLDLQEYEKLMSDIWGSDEDTRSLKSLLLLGLRGMAAYAWHAYVLGYKDDEVMNWFYVGMAALAETKPVNEWVDMLMELGQINLKCMELLDKANTGTYGTPAPVNVTTIIEKGPFIVVSGHDLLDLKQLLEQTEGKGINIYTHGEMLPAHGYPELKKYSHLKGNFGTAWQNQQKEFDNVPGAFLFTTNCLMPPRASYSDRVFTTEVVGYPGLVHIESNNGKKDFSPVIERALELGGYPEDKIMTGINGGTNLITGFGHGTVLSAADKVVNAIKAGKLNHIFLVGGCDGAKPGRNYYTEFVKQTPSDTLVLTLACGKYRFNDLDLGTIEGLPRIMDMGQCNDSYSAIKVAITLAEVFNCGVNDLPLSLVLSWYEQKAVIILLTLLSLGVKNIRLGPTLPAFISPNILNFLVENFQVKPVTTPEQDLKDILV